VRKTITAFSGFVEIPISTVRLQTRISISEGVSVSLLLMLRGKSVLQAVSEPRDVALSSYFLTRTRQQVG
jgi:hypothetical protein